MKSCIHRSAIFILLIFVGLAPALSQDIHFNKITFPDAINNLITDITQDLQGNIWFSADGICRYDGVHLKKYTNDHLNPNSISNNRIECVYADKKGFIWAGGYGGGLNKLDPKTGIFTHYQHDAKNPNSISGDTITCILEDKEGMIWLGTDMGGIDRMDPRTEKFENFRHKENDPGSLSFNQVRVIYEDKKGDLWIGCGGPFHENQSGQDGGLNRFDRKTGKFISYKHNDKDPQTLIDNRVRAIFEDSRGIFWVGTAGDGLHTMNRETGTFERHEYDHAHPEKLSRPPQNKYFDYADDHITFINEDQKGYIWIGAFEGGLTRYNPVTKKITRYNIHDNPGAGYMDSTSWGSFISRDGVMWISAWYNEMYRVDPSQQNILHTPTNHRVLSFLEDPGNGLYLGTDSGLMFLDKKNNITRLYVNDPKKPGSISDNRIFSIYKDKKNRIWTGNDGNTGGINLFNPEQQSFTVYLYDPKSNDRSKNSVYSMYEDHLSNLWLGSNFGLEKLNVETGEFSRYPPFPDDTIPGGYNRRNFVLSILEDSRHNLWATTVNGGGVHLFDRKTGKFKHYLNKNSVVNLFEDSGGKLWVGADEGLYSYDKAADDFILFDDPTTGNSFNITGIQEDRDKNLWITSSTGIFRIERDRKTLTRFSKNVGLSPETFSSKDIYKAKDGQLFIGNIDGFYSFYPEKLNNNSTPPGIILTDFRIAGHPVVPGSSNAISEDLLAAKKIQLTYNQDVFSFSFNIVHYGDPEANRAVYMLDNYDKQWRNSGSERSAFYYNIPPGKYTFRIRASSNYGVWAEKSIDVIISPPWWLRWWAYVLYALTLAGIGLAIHRTIKQRVINAERERTREREMAQAKEIEKAYHELKTTQSQLIQSEKMASLGELTAGIAHEIQNPLNFVNNFSEVNTELIDEMQMEMGKGNYEDAKTISDNIKQNEQKINYQGKRADAIVKSMLQHSRTTSEHKEATSINALADEYLRLAYHGLRAKDKSFNATLITDFDPGIRLMNVIPQDIGRVLLNLYNNSFYAVSARVSALANGKDSNDTSSASEKEYSPTIVVTTKLANHSKDIDPLIRNPQSVIISVRDNGMGIPEKLKAKIFQPFFTTKPTGQGTGLGLSLSYDIIKAHGGEIKVDSKEGEYTEFTILIPC